MNQVNDFLPDLPNYGDLFNELDKEDEPIEPEAAMPEADEFTKDSFDSYIAAQVLLPRDGDKLIGTVKRWAKDEDRKPVGKRNANPILDTREYVIEFPDGSSETYMANIIAENLYSQVDEEGAHYQLLHKIIDHWKDASALGTNNGFYVNRSGTRVPKMMTRGWQLLVNWKDGSSSWVPLKDLKESHPLEVAEYAKGNGISSKPAFAWWVHRTL